MYLESPSGKKYKAQSIRPMPGSQIESYLDSIASAGRLYKFCNRMESLFIKNAYATCGSCGDSSTEEGGAKSKTGISSRAFLDLLSRARTDAQRWYVVCIFKLLIERGPWIIGLTYYEEGRRGGASGKVVIEEEEEEEEGEKEKKVFEPQLVMLDPRFAKDKREDEQAGGHKDADKDKDKKDGGVVAEDDDKKPDEDGKGTATIMDIHPIQVIQDPPDTPFSAWPPDPVEKVPLIVNKDTMTRVFVGISAPRMTGVKCRLTFNKRGANEITDEITATLIRAFGRTWVLTSELEEENFNKALADVPIPMAPMVSMPTADFLQRASEKGWDAFNFTFPNKRVRPSSTRLEIEAKVFYRGILMDARTEISPGNFKLRRFRGKVNTRKYIIGFCEYYPKGPGFKKSWYEISDVIEKEVRRLAGTYPIPEDAVEWRRHVAPGRIPRFDMTEGLMERVDNTRLGLWLSEAAVKGGLDRLVAVLPTDALDVDYCFFVDERYGFTPTLQSKSILVTEDMRAFTVAHEIGHTYGHWHDYAGTVHGGWNVYGAMTGGLQGGGPMLHKPRSLMEKNTDWINLKEYMTLVEELTR